MKISPIKTTMLLTSGILFTACGDIEDTKEYQTGYDDGYYDGQNQICDDWKKLQPDNLYERYKPRSC